MTNANGNETDGSSQPVEQSRPTTQMKQITQEASDLSALLASRREALSLGEVMAEIESRQAARSLPPVDPDWEKKQAERIAAHEAAERNLRTEEAWRYFVSRIGNRYAGCTVKGFEKYGNAAEKARQSEVVASLAAYGRDLIANVNRGAGILLFGPPGTGKDHLLAGLAQFAIKSYGLTVGFWYGLDMFGEARDRIDEDKSEAAFLKKFESPRILILSDPIAPMGDLTTFQSGLLTRIVNARYRLQRPTWVTINARNKAEMGELLGAQVISRLEHNALAHWCAWPDYRAQKEVKRG